VNEETASKSGVGRITESESRAFAKVARRLIPLMILLYLVSFLDRVNVSFAALTMNADLGLTATQFGWGAGIFFLGYVLFEVPSNLALERFGAKRWIFRIMITWGLISSAMALVEGPRSFVALRLLLGFAEAGFFPGMILYLTYWFPAAMRARFVAGFMVAVPLASVIGAPLSSFLLEFNGAFGLHGWQWLFIVEGVPACVLAFAVLAWLPDGPRQAAWLSAEEVRTIEHCLEREQSAHRATLQAVWPALRDLRVLLLGLVYLGIVIGLYGIGFWLPQIIRAMGYGNFEIGLIVAIPYAMSAAVMLWWGRRSDSKEERVRHVVWPAFLSAAGFAGAASVTSGWLALLMLSLAAIGIYAALAPLWAAPSLFLQGSAAAGGLALINAIGNIGGFIGPYVVGWLKDATQGYALAMAVLSLSVAISGVIMMVIGKIGADQTVQSSSRNT
jgi:ACS family tartrate transporter-like MFS transporter